MLLENLSMAIHAIKANKMRSFLTMLGIIIGIGAVISIVSIGDTMRGTVADLYKNVGETRGIIYFSPEDGEFRDSDFFTLDDMDQMKEVFGDDITYIDNDTTVGTKAINGYKDVKIQLSGINNNYDKVQPLHMLYGRKLNEADIKGRKKNVVLEEAGAIKLFGVSNAVGKSFRATIYGETDEYYVVGVYRLEQTPFEAVMAQMTQGDGELGFVPYTILTRQGDEFFELNIFAKTGTNMKEFSIRCRQYIAKTKNRTSNDVTFYSVADEMSSVDTILNGLSIAVGCIAGISLLVGGIGIMNIMLVSVTERTREIGIRKALGAKTKDVLFQFLMESAILSALGGIIGIVSGVGLVLLGGMLFGMNVVVRSEIIILAVSFSALVGVFFGLYPASKAAQSDPIDALRYE